MYYFVSISKMQYTSTNTCNRTTTVFLTFVCVLGVWCWFTENNEIRRLI